MTVGSIRFTEEQRSALIVVLDSYKAHRCGCAGPHEPDCDDRATGWTAASASALAEAHSRLIQAGAHDPA